MNTPESDRMQVEYVAMWSRKKAKKKMDKQEEKLLKFAKDYFGENVAIIYARAGAVVVDRDTGEESVIVPKEI